MESVLELEGGWLSLRCEEATPAIFPICQKYWGLVVVFYITLISFFQNIWNWPNLWPEKGIPERSWTLAVKLLEPCIGNPVPKFPIVEFFLILIFIPFLILYKNYELYVYFYKKTLYIWNFVNCNRCTNKHYYYYY